MIRELQERLKVVSHCPLKVFVASYIPRYWYPYRLQHAGQSTPWAKDESLELIMDSAIGDNSVDNQTVLDTAHERNADFVIPADTLDDQEQTTNAVREFVQLYEDHDCRAKPMIPLQPPYDEHYHELSGFSHYTLGGIAEESAGTQLSEIRTFRDEAGYGPYAHGLGLGASLTLIRAFREDPRLLDSLDLSTPEQVVTSDRLQDKTMKQHGHQFPTGTDSSTIRAAYASAQVLQLNYMLGPFCDDDLLESEWRQTSVVEPTPATDGGSHD